MGDPSLHSIDRDLSADSEGGVSPNSNSAAVEELMIQRITVGDSLAAAMIVSYLGDRLLVLTISGMPNMPVSDSETVLEAALEHGIGMFGDFDAANDSIFSWFSRHVQFESDHWLQGHSTTHSTRSAASASGSSFRKVSRTLRDRTEASLDALEPKDRLVLALRCWQGLSFRTISVRLGIKEPTARQQFKRALEKLELKVNGRGGASDRTKKRDDLDSEWSEVKRVIQISGSNLFDEETKQKVWALRSADHSVSPELRERLIAMLRRSLRSRASSCAKSHLLGAPPS